MPVPPPTPPRAARSIPHRPPWELPALQVHLGGRTVVLIVDANLVMRDLHRLATRPDDAPPALLELLRAPQVRIVMSAADLRIGASGAIRLEANIRGKHPAHADAMLEHWHRSVRPYVYPLDPTGLPDTSLSQQVRTPQRDPDDADLALLASILDADAVLTYDGEAFQGLIRVMAGTGEHGRSLSAFRDDLRVEQVVGLVFGLPLAATGQALGAASQGLERAGVSPMQALVAGGAVLVGLAVWRRGRKTLARLAATTWEVLESLMPEPGIRAQMQAEIAGLATDWPPMDAPALLAIRHLIRQRGSMTCTELVRALRLPLTPGELYPQLEALPGLVQPMAGRRWWIRQGA